MKLKSLIELFLSEYQNAGTRQSYFYVLQPMLEFLGNRPITDITPPDIVAYGIELANHYPNLSTRNKHIIAIKRFFNRQVELEIIDRSPAKKAIKKQIVRRDSLKDKALPDTELNNLIEFLKVNGKSLTPTRRMKSLRGLALVMFLADTGCRIGGATTLKINDLELENCKAYVVEKFGKPRPVAYGPATANILKQWLLMRKGDKGDIVFTYRGQSIKPDNLAQFFRRLCIDAGIHSYGPHSLRHRKGFQFSDARLSPALAATALGHERVETTLKHYYPKDWGKAHEAIRELALKSEDNIDEKIIPIPHRKRS